MRFSKYNKARHRGDNQHAAGPLKEGSFAYTRKQLQEMTDHCHRARLHRKETGAKITW
jgi:hypothetical protein